MQGKPQFMCDQCPNVYISQLSLKMHLKTAHSGKIYKTTTKKHRKCPHCVKTFTTLTSYKEHLKVKHENSTPYKCDLCHRSYGTKSRLKVHKRNMHQRIKVFYQGVLTTVWVWLDLWYKSIRRPWTTVTATILFYFISIE